MTAALWYMSITNPPPSEEAIYFGLIVAVVLAVIGLGVVVYGHFKK